MKCRLKGCLWKPGVNGLGVLGFHRLPYRVKFEKAAYVHDTYYDCKGTWHDRYEYDVAFLRCMIGCCESDCQILTALFYYIVVRMFGWAFYRYDR